jgi:hypothetical protein
MDSVHFIGSLDKKHQNYIFSWDYGNGITSNARPFPKFIYRSIGEYTAKMRYADSVGGDITDIYQTYVVLDSASKKQLAKRTTTDDENVNLLLVPNPTKRTFTIYTNNGQPIDNIQIFDVLGRICFSSYAPKSNVFDISSFSPGIYFVKIYSGCKQWNQKLIKD